MAGNNMNNLTNLGSYHKIAPACAEAMFNIAVKILLSTTIVRFGTGAKIAISGRIFGFMMNIPDYPVNEAGVVSAQFLHRGINTFKGACGFIKSLPYGRNPNKYDLLTVFSDGCGTCSTKHALLKQLANEQGYPGIELMMGIYKMNGTNTRPVAPVLEKYQLQYIPEAHNYLRCKGEVIDCTAIKPLDFMNDLLDECVIEPGQVVDYKIFYHKHYLAGWIKTKNIKYSLDEIWTIREACIAALATI